MNSFLSIVLPTFNEEGNIPPPADLLAVRRPAQRRLHFRTEELP